MGNHGDTKEMDRGARTKFALIHMGPSILAAAFTTVAGATIMLFTVISFFSKFAIVLFLTIIQATTGSFIVFLTTTDCIGPSNPTYTMDKISENLNLLRKGKGKDDSICTSEDTSRLEKL